MFFEKKISWDKTGGMCVYKFNANAAGKAFSKMVSEAYTAFGTAAFGSESCQYHPWGGVFALRDGQKIKKIPLETEKEGRGKNIKKRLRFIKMKRG